MRERERQNLRKRARERKELGKERRKLSEGNERIDGLHNVRNVEGYGGWPQIATKGA